MRESIKCTPLFLKVTTSGLDAARQPMRFNLLQNANRKIGVTICNLKQIKPVAKALLLCVVLCSAKQQHSCGVVGQRLIFSFWFYVKWKKGHIKVLIKLARSSIRTSPKRKKKLKQEVCYYICLPHICSVPFHTITDFQKLFHLEPEREKKQRLIW